MGAEKGQVPCNKSRLTAEKVVLRLARWWAGWEGGKDGIRVKCPWREKKCIPVFYARTPSSIIDRLVFKLRHHKDLSDASWKDRTFHQYSFWFISTKALKLGDTSQLWLFHGANSPFRIRTVVHNGKELGGKLNSDVIGLGRSKRTVPERQQQHACAVLNLPIKWYSGFGKQAIFVSSIRTGTILI